MPRRRIHRQGLASDFAFVNYTHPAEARDPEVQQTVRRHVMKDIGFARRRKPYRTVIDLDIDALLPRNVPLAGEDTHASLEANTTTCYVNFDSICWLPRPNPVGIFGVDLTPRDLQLVHFLIADGEYNYRAFHSIWVRIGLSNSTCLYLTLASAVLFQARFIGQVDPDIEDSPESNRYYLKALRRLNRSLAHTTESRSPGVVATILGCLCHDTHINDWDRWATHIEGLKRLSDCRGGFEDLEEHIGLTAWWLDLVGCSVLDQRPRFDMPRDVAPLGDDPSSTQTDIEGTIKQAFNDLPELYPIMPIVIGLVHAANIVREGRPNPLFWQDAIGGISLIGPLIHQLLTMPKLSDHSCLREPAPAVIVRELMRLVFLMLLSCLKKCLSLHASDMESLQNRTTIILEHNLESVSATMNGLVTWAASTFASIQRNYVGDTEHTGLSFVMAIENLLTTLKVMNYIRDNDSVDKVYPT